MNMYALLPQMPQCVFTHEPHVEVGEKIGYGAFGDVHSVVVDGVPCVRKQLHKATEISQSQFDIEAKLLQRICHPNIVALVGVTYTVSGETKELFLEDGGECLFDAVASGAPLPPFESMCKQILMAVAHLHSHNIIHRDIKLENLLYSANRIKLIDFGLAILVSDPSEELTVPCGSAMYAAPEVRTGKYWGPQADAWSTGVCLFSLYYGFFPFQRIHPQDRIFGSVCRAQKHNGSGDGTVLAIAGIYADVKAPPSPTLLSVLDGLLTVAPDRRLLV